MSEVFLLAGIVLHQGLLPATADELIQDLNNADQRTVAPAQSTIKNRNGETTDDFIPLLAPFEPQKKVELSREKDIFHGWLRSRDIFQKVNNGKLDNESRLESGGSLDRVHGNALSLVWNGSLDYRQGNAFTSADDHLRPRLHVFQLALEQRQDDGGLSRLGRFVPTELPGLGYVDGALEEGHPSDHLHLGAILGARPERRELDFSTQELVTSGYASFEDGVVNERYYCGTVGILQTLRSGIRDEFALLYDQRADLNPKLNVFLSSQVNFNDGAALIHTEAARLTRLDLNLNSALTSLLSVRTGINHYERPDTAVERDLSAQDLTTFDNGYWRYWTGSSQRLPWNLRFDEEVALIRAPGETSQGQVHGTVSRTGILGMSQAVVSWTTFSLTRLEGQGIGSILSSGFPLLENRVTITANAGTRYVSSLGAKKKFTLSDSSIYANWFISKTWEAAFGLTEIYENSIQSTLLDSSLNYRW